MSPLDPVVFRELPLIQKIIQDETWLEGERRGCLVPPGDPVVQTKVCEVVLRIGQQLRDSIALTLVPDPSGESPESERRSAIATNHAA